MKNLIPGLVALFCWVAPMGLAGQSSCYEKVRNDGLSSLAQGRFGDAINQFWAAWISCDDKPQNHDLEALIRRAVGGWVTELETRVSREREARLALEQSKLQLQQANNSLAEERNRAESNARMALEQGQRAEALRLVMLSESARLQTESSDALLLAVLALRLASEENRPIVWRTLAYAAKDSLSRSVFSGQSQVTAIQAMPTDPNLIIVQTQDNALFQLELSRPGAYQLAPPSPSPVHWALSPVSPQLLIWSGNEATLVHGDRSGRQVLSGHSAPIRSGAFSPDGKWIVSCARDHTARIWEASTGRAVATLGGHDGPVYQAVFSPTADRVLTRSSDGSVRTWLLDGTLLTQSPKAGVYVHDALFLTDASAGHASASADGVLRLWDPQGQLRDSCRFAQAPLVDIHYLPSSHQLLIRAADGTCQLASAQQLRQSTSLSASSPVVGLATQGDRILSWHQDHQLRLWSAGGSLLRTFSGHQSAIRKAAISADGTHLLSIDVQNNARLWASSGELLLDWIAPGGAWFSPDHTGLISTDNTGQHLQWFPLPHLAQQNIEVDKTALEASATRLSEKYGLSFVKLIVW